jgi:cytochrome bd ubiquinol oxidase subunit II
MSSAWIAYLIIGAGLVAYVLTAGADFGGGAWDLLARGPRKQAQRAAIEHAIAPIWEANHVWLIFVIVVLFTAFPIAFSTISIALHIPITLALIGIVLRGAAFTFRAYGLVPSETRARWGHVFAWASSLTPVFLGATLGALATGDIRVTGGEVTSGFLAGWTTPFALFVGVFALTLFTLLAAVYLSAECAGELREDFRRRALFAELAGAIVAALVLWRASIDAPLLFERLLASSWSLFVQGTTAIAALATISTLWTRRPRIARFTAAIQVGLVVLGFGLAMDGAFVLPDLPIEACGAKPEVLAVVLPAILIGSLVLLPSLFYLLRVFKKAA